MHPVRVRAKTARRQPDPSIRGAEMHRLIIDAADYPKVPLNEETNPRSQNTDLSVYRDVAKALLNQDGTKNTFHLRNKGITWVADSVSQVKGSEDEYFVDFSLPIHGVADGGHTSRIIWENQDQMKLVNGGDLQQYVKVDVLVGYPEELIPEIIEGLNSSISVAEYSLLNFTGQFDWMKTELDAEGFANVVSFRQNDTGMLDVRDVFMRLDALNTVIFKNEGTEYPIRSYSSKQTVLKAFATNPDRYKWMSSVLVDAMRLYDTIAFEGRDKFYERQGTRRASTERFVETRKRGNYVFPFIKEESENRLMHGAVMPVLSGFRQFVETDKNGLAHWKGSFEYVLDAWDHFGGDLMVEVWESTKTRDLNPLAKDRSFWANLHKQVAIEEAKRANS